MAQFFVSYSRSVKDEIGKVIDLLRASGHEVWWDGDIPIMADWWATILDNIEWCEVFIFVTSEKSVESPYCIAELQYANERGRPILPFMLENPAMLALPPELPHRNQWLIYDGDPANMLRQINTAYQLINWQQHTDINARRPPEPNKGGVSLARQYQDARQLAFEMEFERAKNLLRNIKRLDYGEWGHDCDEWLGRINAYAPLIELVQHDSTHDKAERDWRNYVRRYSSDFDPYQIEQKLKARKSPSKLPMVSIIAIVIVVGILIVGLLMASSGGTGDNTTTDEPATTQDINADDARATGAAQAYETLTALAPTNTPTITPTPTDTPISSSDIQQTTQAEIFATETVVAQTQAVIAQETQNTVLTEQFSAGSTATYIAQLSLTPPATNTLPPTPTPTATHTPMTTPTSTPTPDPLQAAFTPVARDADGYAIWTPVVRDFDGVTMVLVPVGCFMMGSDANSDEQPVHEQCFDEPFWIDQYEVTQAQFRRLGGIQANTPSFVGDNRPVENITWFEARDFCESRGGRLPTEAEWEYAARGPDSLVYPWGNTWNASNAVWNRNSSQGTADVGSIPAGVSWVGALDMIGNVWEWISSLNQSYPYNATDGREADTGSRTDVWRVLRGGSWGFNISGGLRAPFRGWYAPSVRVSRGGFRCARSYE